MPFHRKNGLRYFTFALLADLPHAVFTRQGGVSPPPWDSLNVGGSVGDDLHNVYENRRRAFLTLERDPASIFDSWLVHDTGVIYVDAPRDLTLKPPQADILITHRPDVTLFMRYADCVPLLLYDPVQQVIAVAHAGWLGTVRNVVQATLEAMHRRYGTNPKQVRAAIGPSIGPDHYEIGADVIERVRSAFPEQASQVLIARGDRVYFDLWEANRLQLEAAGVQEIEVARLCTACHLEDWYSHRAERGKTGRFGVLLALPS